MKKVLITGLCRRSMAATLIIILSNPGVAQDAEKNKQETEPVNVAVIVKDTEGMRVQDLKKEDFEIYEDGVLQEITHFKAINQPLRLILLFDTSTSMELVFRAIQDETAKLVESLNQLDEVMVASFDADLQWHTDWVGKAVAAAEIRDLRSTAGAVRRSRQPFPGPPVGVRDVNTDLYTAMHTLFERVGGRDGNEVVLLFSDGKDVVDRELAKQRPVKESKQVIQEAQKSWAQIYAACFKIERMEASNPIGIGRLGRKGGSDCKFLSEIADATGGRTFEFESQAEFALILKKAFDEMRSQYYLTYTPSSQGSRIGYHKIRTVVKRPNVVARAREGYLVSK